MHGQQKHKEGMVYCGLVLKQQNWFLDTSGIQFSNIGFNP